MISKKAFFKEGGKALPVMESFYSIQGEGTNTGMPAFFIRIGGCDVGCHWCDVKESWEAKIHPVVAVEKILEDIQSTPAVNVIITGGEPLMYNLELLTKKIKDAGYKTHLETSGAYALSGNWDWICLSPKKLKLPLEETAKKANELKVIIYNMDDFRFAQECRIMAEKNNQNKPGFFLQPEWSRRDLVLPSILDFVKKNPSWRISLQAHKYIGVR